MSVQNKNNGNSKKEAGKHQHPLPQEMHAAERVAADKAHEQAEHDIEEDPDLSIHSPNDDLDEGETSLLGNDEIPVI